MSFFLPNHWHRTRSPVTPKKNRTQWKQTRILQEPKKLKEIQKLVIRGGRDPWRLKKPKEGLKGLKKRERLSSDHNSKKKVLCQRFKKIEESFTEKITKDQKKVNCHHGDREADQKIDKLPNGNWKRYGEMEKLERTTIDCFSRSGNTSTLFM